jgi:hypothetical protein
MSMTSIHDELVGNLAFGLLLGSALLNLSIIVAYKVGSASVQIANRKAGEGSSGALPQ